MNWNHLTKAVCLAAVLLTRGFLTTTMHAQNELPVLFRSPDGRQTIKRRPLLSPHAAVGGKTIFAMELCEGTRRVAEFATEGYLMGAFWSPDGRHVAVNNRRTGQGDCLWVLRARDGHPLKQPADAPPPRRERQSEAFERELVQAAVTLFSAATFEDLRQTVTFSTGWTPADELKVETYAYFDHWPGQVLEVSDVYVIREDGLQRTSRAVRQRAARPHEALPQR